MENTILFVILPQYADWEAAYISSAITMLGEGKYDIKTVSTSRDPVPSIGGLKVIPDYDIQSVPDSYKALILIGGLTWRDENAQKVKTLVRDCQKNGKILAGICDAAAFLGTTGALNDVIHTSNDLADLEQWAGSAYTGKAKHIPRQAVRDKNIITANGTAPMEFAKEILLALEIADREKIMEWYNFHRLGFYTAPMPNMQTEDGRV